MTETKLTQIYCAKCKRRRLGQEVTLRVTVSNTFAVQKPLCRECLANLKAGDLISYGWGKYKVIGLVKEAQQ